MSCAYLASEVVLRKTKYCVPKIFISSYIYLCYKFRSSTVTGKQKNASFNMISVYLSALLDFVNIFIRYRPKQRTWNGFHYGFFPIKKLFLRNKNLENFVNVCSKPTFCMLFKFDTSFFSSCSLIRLVNMIWFAPVLAYLVIFTCMYFDLCWWGGNTPQIQQWNA